MAKNKTEQQTPQNVQASREAAKHGWTAIEQSANLEQIDAEIDKRITEEGLTKEAADEIMAIVEEREQERPFTEKELRHITDTLDSLVRERHDARIPRGLLAVGIISLASGLLNLPIVIKACAIFLELIRNDVLSQVSVISIVFSALVMVFLVVQMVLYVVVGVLILRRKRRPAAIACVVLLLALIIALVLNVMMGGFGGSALALLVDIILAIVVASYLSPSLKQERDLGKRLRMMDTKARAETGMLGLEEQQGKGYIKLDFFNLFWIFVAGCIIGLLVELVWHMVVVDPGVYQDRAGLLFGPFSPIYGCGAVLMTLAMNKYKERNFLIVFVVCTVVGGAFEYFTSWFMEVGFGAVAWDYHGFFLGDLLGGRTCLLYASMFGALGTVWIKLLLPLLLKGVNAIPWKVRYSVTSVCAALMLVNCVMTLQSLDCWFERVSGKTPVTNIELFYADNYDDEWMQNRFQTMTITPSKSIRGDVSHPENKQLVEELNDELERISLFGVLTH